MQLRSRLSQPASGIHRRRQFCHAVARPNNNKFRVLKPTRAPKPAMAAAQDSQMPVMACDYGFRSGASRLYQAHYGEVPKSLAEMATENFRLEFLALRRAVRFDEYEEMALKNPAQNLVQKALYAAGTAFSKMLGGIDRTLENAGVFGEVEPPASMPTSIAAKDDFKKVRKQIRSLYLNNADVVAYEDKRRELEGETVSPWFIKLPYLTLCWALDVVFEGRPIQRFWVLEVVARIPYFSYISMLHLYESLGWWRAGAELRKIHFAEEWNELHHLQIMESLGGDSLWFDRFLAQHAALVYYWVLVLFFMLSPRLAYNFSELVEHHATDTYTVFADTNKEALQQIPPPKVAVEYYLNEDLYLFDEFQTEAVVPRRPQCDNLYDVFINIRDDEREHVKTMIACQDTKIASQVANKRH